MEIRTVESPVYEHVPPNTEETRGTSKMSSDRGSIEWDVSQMRQERVDVGSSSPHVRPAPELLGKGSSPQQQNGCEETSNAANGEVLSSSHGTPLENNFSTDGDSWKSSSPSSSLLNVVRNGVLPHRTPNSLSSTVPLHLCNSSLSGTLSSSPSTVLSSSIHSNEKTDTAVQKSSCNSDAHVLEPQLTSKQITSRLKNSGDTDRNIVIDGHEE